MSSAVAERPGAAPASAALGLIDDEHPWLGLDSFSEETRQYFHGREEEIAELARRVQHKLLTILFGQSGLGKTSILRAGIVPRLRREGYCPVYVRVDYSGDSPAPAEQIKRAVFHETETSGKWTKAGAAVEGESLWEFLHHRDDILEDSRGKPLLPLLIFDQFEEIFTIGQGDDFGRRRAAEFIEDLADLVENRPPAHLEQLLDSDDSVADRFDFSRADYRVLVSLREDYLANLEAYRGSMPSVTQNRMRLARMTGQQALAAVTRPGGRLVTEEVAEAIVRFVAGGAELRNADVEPSLLSLICRELNNARVTQGRAEISADLLAGSRETILLEFYERALKDQPPGVRRFIEDEMLTESGFRESLAEERVVKAFAAAGAPAGSLPALVNRRLLRIEERLDLRRVELTHDVLCKVVIESRDARHEREAREAIEQQLAAERAAKAAAHQSLVRARKVALACGALAVLAVGGGLFGFIGMKHSQRSEASATATRGEAEKLVVYLIDDFYLELAPVGRLDTVAGLAKRALDYYGGLPQDQRTPETERNRALAQVRHGQALSFLGDEKLDGSDKALAEAIGVLERLVAEGDRSELTAVGLGIAYAAQARLRLFQGRDSEQLQSGKKAVESLQPLMSQANPSIRVKRAYGDAMTRLGFAQIRSGSGAEGAKTLAGARDAYRGIDGLTLGDLGAAAAYGEASAWLMEALAERLGREDEARRIGEEAAPVVERVLERRPGHMAALRSHALIMGSLATMEANALRLAKAMELSRRQEADLVAFARLDPGNSLAWMNLQATRAEMGWWLFAMGRPGEAIAMWRSVLAMFDERSNAVMTALATWVPGWIAVLQSDLGAHRQEIADYRRRLEPVLASVPKGSFWHTFLQGAPRVFDGEIDLVLGAYTPAMAAAREAIRHAEGLKTTDEDTQRWKDSRLARSHRDLASAAYNLGDFAGASTALREALGYLAKTKSPTLPTKIEASEYRILLALAEARQGRLSEARALAETELGFEKDLLARGSENLEQHVTCAKALFAMALAAPGPSARGYLTEAAQILDRLPSEMARRRTVAQVRGWIADEMKRN